MTKPLIEINNLNISFQMQGVPKSVVADASFVINKGEVLGLLGESGSGKSMSSLAIMNLLPAGAQVDSNSQIIFQGQDLLRLSEVQMRTIRGKRIAMIFQEPMTSLNPVLTIGEQVHEAIKAHSRLRGSKAKQKIIELLTDVGLRNPESLLRSYPHQLSGGMKQRVMIAMAIAGEPDLLIADEPTSALDVTIQKQIIDLLKQIQQKTGMAMLFISHDLAVIKTLADNVAVMCAGHIVEQGAAKDFFAKPTHPYSQKLLASVPNLAQGDQTLENAPGTVAVEKACLELKDVKVYFPIKKGLLKRTVGYVKAVDGVSLQLAKGKTLAVVGESGCGKTTLAKSILQLIPKTTGEIKINNLVAPASQQLHRYAQIVFQDPFSSMDPRMLVGDIIAEGMRALKVTKKKLQQKKITQLLQQVGLAEDSLNRYPHEFSGGQRQRICIARALAVEPEFIICDEPTSALDVSIQAQVLNLLKKLQHEQQLSYLFISHNIAVVAYMADEVAVMYQGKIVEQGDVRQILTQPQHDYTKRLLAAVPTEI